MRPFTKPTFGNPGPFTKAKQPKRPEDFKNDKPKPRPKKKDEEDEEYESY